MQTPSRSSGLIEQEQALGDSREIASVFLNYGNQKRLTGDYVAAAELLEKAVALLEAAGESASRSLAAALSNLGLVYSRQGRGREGVHLLERALAIHEKSQSLAASLSVRNSLVVHAPRPGRTRNRPTLR